MDASTPLIGSQAELLEVAFEVATAIPVRPHLKDRSRAQESVVEACLQLSQPQRALDCLKRIDDWRRGLCYADLALYCVQHGCTEEVSGFLVLAAESAKLASDWRRDRIRVQIAKVHALQGKSSLAAELQTGVENSEAGKVLALKGDSADGTSFDERMHQLDLLLASGNFDVSRNALSAAASLFDQFYNDPEKRDRVEAAIRSYWEPMPIPVRFELLRNLADSSLEHSDHRKGAELTDEAQRLINDYRWKPEQRIPMLAAIAVLRQKVGEPVAARRDAESALALYEASVGTIVDIWRARTLRSVAEAYQSTSGKVAALTLFKRCVEEGVVNPNSRPRAEDLAATCISMAVHSVNPDDHLWARIRQIQKGLGQPW